MLIMDIILWEFKIIEKSHVKGCNISIFRKNIAGVTLSTYRCFLQNIYIATFLYFFVEILTIC